MHEKQNRERVWETHLEFADTFLDDEDCLLIDQMKNPDKFLIVLLCSVTLASSFPATQRENQHVKQKRVSKLVSKPSINYGGQLHKKGQIRLWAALWTA